MRRLQLAALLIASAPVAARGQEASAKDGYWLLRPTPRGELRELSTDRPDTTESPHTVDAGHVQIELETISVSWDREPGGSERVYTSLATANLKLGLANQIDLQAVVRPLERAQTLRGFGDLDLRLKVNLWGNDGGPTALALMPVVTFPTGGALGAGDLEGGLIVPLGIELPADFEAGLMLQGNAVRTPDDDGYEAEVLGTATVSRAVAGDLRAFGEVAATGPLTRARDLAVTANFGLVFAIDGWWQLDGGANVGLTDAADDVRGFVGLSARF